MAAASERQSADVGVASSATRGISLTGKDFGARVVAPRCRIHLGDAYLEAAHEADDLAGDAEAIGLGRYEDRFERVVFGQQADAVAVG